MAKESTAAVVQIRDQQPDFTKSVDLKYWALPVGEYFGNRTNRLVTVDGTYDDGIIAGKCSAIKLMPGGVVTIVVEQGWQPGKLDTEQKLRTRYVVCIGSCHGVTP